MGFTALRFMIRPLSTILLSTPKTTPFPVSPFLRTQTPFTHFTLCVGIFTQPPKYDRFRDSTSPKPTPVRLRRKNENFRPPGFMALSMHELGSPVTRQNKKKRKKLGSGLDWPILKRWDVHWQWKTVSLALLACGSSFVLTGLIQEAALPYLGVKFAELSLDAKAGIMFVNQGIVTAVVLGVLFCIINKSGPLPEDTFRYDMKNPFGLRKGWLLWAAVGFIGALSAIILTGFVMYKFYGGIRKPKNDAFLHLLPFIGSSSVSTLWVIGIVGVLAPLLEETVFRGFFMVAMTKWVPTPVAVVISAAVFALSHLTPEMLPQAFVLGVVLGFSYAKTRNLMAPITIHASWNSGLVALVHWLKVQGYDIRKLLQAKQRR